MKTNIKSIAYYLPQFHQIPENDEWWGEGFTEWTNVKKATPLFSGHHQPKIPYEYYDLSNINAMYKQIEMAKKYGLYGFCFYYYWFSGKRLLEKPVENFLKDQSPQSDFPFMICWANENWTRTWDGADQNVLIKQSYKEGDHYSITLDFIRHFKDSRYIKDDGCPILMIYRPTAINKFPALIKTIRDECKKHGFPGVKILASEAFNFKNNQRFDIDGIIQFPPHSTFSGNSPNLNSSIGLANNNSLEVKSFSDFVDKNLAFYKKYFQKKIPHSKLFYPCSFPSWDNTPRKKNHGRVYHDYDIDNFKKWLNAAKEFTIKYNKDAEKFIFINAWNEWAEGAHLEPDRANGFSRLEALKDIMYN